MYDIPPITMVLTEHQGEIKRCPTGITVNKAVFPEGVNQPVQYGSGVQTWAAYFTQYQLLPFARTAQLFGGFIGHWVSTSFLVNNNQRLGELLQPYIRKLRKKLLSQPLLHAYETEYDYKGKRNWLHTLCTEKHIAYAT